MRRRISKQTKWTRYIFLAIGLGILFVIIDKTINEAMELNTALIISIGMIFIGLIYYLTNEARTIEFDTKYMYVIRSSREEQVELKNIIGIKLTMTEVNGSYMWKIDYYDEISRLKSVKFFPSWFNSNFQEFKDLVKVANKNVLIKNSTNSFDF